jgi:hypothetical protein
MHNDDASPHIRLWMPEYVPVRFRRLIPFANDSGVLVMFVAHVPAEVLASKTYQECESNPHINGWIREGELGLFGTNALNTIPHPDGDGILIVGSCV